jgi:hypothetical protein
VWALKTGQASRKLIDLPLIEKEMTASFSPDGRLLATAEQNTALLVWRIPE